MVVPWDGPAPALSRGASRGRSEDRFYALWRDALWRELCGVVLSAHEPWGEGRSTGYAGVFTAPKNSTEPVVESWIETRKG